MGLIREIMDELDASLQSAIAPYLTAGEKVLHAETCEQTGFFWRVFPLTPDWMEKRSIFVLTQKRILVLRRKYATMKGGYPIKKDETLPLDEIASMKSKRGMLTSSLVIRDTSGRKWPFYNLLKSTAEGVVGIVNALREEAT